MKILIIGGDGRMTRLCERLASDAHEVYAYATGKLPSGVRECGELYSAPPSFDIIILPLPVSRDGININAPEYTGEPIAVSDLFETIPKGKILLAGKISRAHKDKAKDFGLCVIDYYEREGFINENAYITAEGGIKIAMDALGETLRDASHLIIGGGRIARNLLLTLRGFQARVALAARNIHDLRWAKAIGADTVDLLGDSEELEAALSRSRVIYNTVPEPTIPDSAYEYVKKDAIYIELVGDENLVSPLLTEKGVYCTCAKALPAKYAPDSAAALLYETISEIIKGKGE